MPFRRLLQRLAWVAATIVLLLVIYHQGVRPWYRRWGTIGDEAKRRLPGDELVVRPQDRSTRAIRIAASPEAVWPWLIQMGHGKAGLYSYEGLENLFGCDLHNADHLVAKWQFLKVGDRLALGPQGYPSFDVVRLEPPRLLVLKAGDATTVSTWAFVLVPDGAGTRLLVRSLRHYPLTVGNRLMWRGLVDPAHFVMERRMLQGIKERVEKAAQNTLGLPSVAGRVSTGICDVPSRAERYTSA